MTKLLLVDDDVEFVELLSELLQLEGFEIDTAYNGKEALEKLNKSHRLILLDIMMPILNGIETLKQIRQHSSTPVMMLTARGNEVDRVIGLELGADDYLPKPFSDRELVARIKAILRRTEPTNAYNENKIEENYIEFCGLTIYPGRQQVIYENKDLELTGSEFALFQTLITNPGKIFSREYLSMEILGKRITPFDRSIDMHMSNLRKKLPPRNDDTPWFKTLRGKGYLLLSSK